MIQVSTLYDCTKQIYEHSDNPSACIPNQSYTPKELVIRYSCGTMPNIKRVATWDNNPDIDNPNPLNDPNIDLVDIQRLKSKNLSRINEMLNPKQNVDEVSPQNQAPDSADSLKESHE